MSGNAAWPVGFHTLAQLLLFLSRPGGLGATAAGSGMMSVWNDNEDAIVGSSCEFASAYLGGLNSPVAQTTYIESQHYCAAEASIFAGGASCGACYRLTYGATSSVVQVVDQGSYTFECHGTVFQELTGVMTATFRITYQAVPCETECAAIAVIDHPNPSYTKLIFNGFRYPPASVAAQIGQQHFSLTHNNGAVWAMVHPSSPPEPVTFNIESTDGTVMAAPQCLPHIWPTQTGARCQVCEPSTSTTSTQTSSITSSTTSTSRTTTTTSTSQTTTTTSTSRTNTATTTSSTSTSRTNTATTTSSSTTSHSTTSTTVTWTGSSTTETVTTTTSSERLSPYMESSPPHITSTERVVDAALPDPFYDIVTSSMQLKIVLTKSSITKKVTAELFSGVARALGNLTGLPSPVLDRVVFLRRDEAASSIRSSVRVFWKFRVRSGFDTSQLTELLDDPETLIRLNALLGVDSPRASYERRPGLIDSIKTAEEICLNAEGLDLGGKFICCERLLLYSLTQNAGVFVPYARCFPFAMAFLCALGGIYFFAARSPFFAEVREGQRIFFVAATFFASHTLVGLLTALQSLDKFRMLSDECMAAAGVATASCPPSPVPMLLETFFGTFVPILAAGAFICWNVGEWQSARLRRARGLAALPGTTTQLEAVLRRSDIWASQEVRPTDAVTKTELKLLVAVNLLLSFAVVLTACFALQRYELPGRFTAWNPYKIVFESVVAVALKYVIKKIVYSRKLGRMTPVFLCVCIACFLSVDVFFWSSIVIMCRSMGLHYWADVQKLLGIIVGAGIINVFSSAFVYTMTFHLFSVYIYEPFYRRRKVHIFCLKSQEDVAQVRALYSKDWRLRGAPMLHGSPVEIEGLDVGSPRKPTSTRNATEETDSGEQSEYDSDFSPSSQESAGSPKRPTKIRNPSKEAPVVVELERADEGRLWSGLLKLMDTLLSVDPALPLDCACRELPVTGNAMEQGLGSDDASEPEPDQEPE